MHREAIGGFVLSLALLSGAAARAGDPVTVVQDDRKFAPDSIAIPKGTVVRFENRDDFTHQMFVADPRMNFESDEQDPGRTIDVPFPTAGSFVVRCRIHPKMLLRVEVR